MRTISQRKLMKQLPKLATRMLFGSPSWTYRTCGNPTCRCKSGGEKHGPNLYVSFRGPEGKTSGYYVPRAFEEQVSEGIDAWREFYEIARNLAGSNFSELSGQIKSARRSRRKAVE